MTLCCCLSLDSICDLNAAKLCVCLINFYLSSCSCSLNTSMSSIRVSMIYCILVSARSILWELMSARQVGHFFFLENIIISFRLSYLHLGIILVNAGLTEFVQTVLNIVRLCKHVKTNGAEQSCFLYLLKKVSTDIWFNRFVC
jgi:hypothetical protein